MQVQRNSKGVLRLTAVFKSSIAFTTWHSLKVVCEAHPSAVLAAACSSAATEMMTESVWSSQDTITEELLSALTKAAPSNLAPAMSTLVDDAESHDASTPPFVASAVLLVQSFVSFVEKSLLLSAQTCTAIVTAAAAAGTVSNHDQLIAAATTPKSALVPGSNVQLLRRILLLLKLVEFTSSVDDAAAIQPVTEALWTVLIANCHTLKQQIQPSGFEQDQLRVCDEQQAEGCSLCVLVLRALMPVQSQLLKNVEHAFVLLSLCWGLQEMLLSMHQEQVASETVRAGKCSAQQFLPHTGPWKHDFCNFTLHTACMQHALMNRTSEVSCPCVEPTCFPLDGLSSICMVD